MTRISSRALLTLAIGCIAACAAHGQAMAKSGAAYPYTLIDPGTFGGPGSFLDLPGVPITSDGTVIGTADTTTPDPDFPSDDFHDGYVQHAFAWRDGRLIDLGAPPPGADNNSEIYDLNDNGVGAGVSETGLVDPLLDFSAQHATVFVHRRLIDLGTLGGYESGAQFIDAGGQVAGISSNTTIDPFPNDNFRIPFGTEMRGFVWRNGVMRDLGTLGGSDTAQAVQNQHGQIAGYSYTNFTPNPTTGLPTIHPFLWDHGHMRDLGSLGGTIALANWMNDRGDVVGVSNLAGDETGHPFLWAHVSMPDLGTLDGSFGAAGYVNNRGDVTGFEVAADGAVHGFLWRDGKLTDLPPVGGAVHAFGNALNDRDQVVGNELDADFNETDASLWSDGHGYDLNRLVGPTSFRMISADFINDQGAIFGHGVYTSGPDKRVARVFCTAIRPCPSRRRRQQRLRSRPRGRAGRSRTLLMGSTGTSSSLTCRNAFCGRGRCG
jgi:probable HAF family extracellular repeat protein